MSSDPFLQFLQWALPKRGLRWSGFRRVRKQVRKRLQRRLKELKLNHWNEYINYLSQHPDEWERLDSFCRITVSRFYRDSETFALLHQNLLPQMQKNLQAQGQTVLRAWSAGAASGEEAYTLRLIEDFSLSPLVPLEIIATDAQLYMLARALTGTYTGGSLRELPDEWVSQAFEQREGLYQLHDRYKVGVTWKHQDLLKEKPSGQFHLILCRNLAFSYFAFELQKSTLVELWRSLYPGGILVLGKHETLPYSPNGLEVIAPGKPIYRKGTTQSEHC